MRTVADLSPAPSPGCEIEHRGAKALALSPAQVHAQQHLRPVLRFGAARAGLDGHDGIQAVAFAGEQRGGLEFRDVFIGRVDLALDVAQQARRAAPRRSPPWPGGDRFRCRWTMRASFSSAPTRAFGRLALLQDLLGLLLILPEIGLRSFAFRGR